MEVKIVKLITGEELLTQIGVSVAEEVTLKQPMVLVMQPGPQGGLQMIPFLMLAKGDSVEIREESILFTYEPKEELANAYRQQVGSIVTAPANALDKQGKLAL